MESAREELAAIAASLRAYVELHRDSGTMGFPRIPREQRIKPKPQPPPTPPSVVITDLPEIPEMPPVSVRSAIEPPPSKADPGPPPRPLPVLQDEVTGCKKCGLHTTRTNTVFARGNPLAKVAFVGEAPGADEDAQGLPFVGRAGQLLDKMIVAMGLDPQTDVYVCNIVKCRPPENRRPTPEESSTCIPYLHEQLANVAPKVIVALGNTSVQTLLGTKVGITKLRGEWKLYRGRVLVMPTYHPSFLLRPTGTQAASKKEAWQDLQKVMKELGLRKV